MFSGLPPKSQNARPLISAHQVLGAAQNFHDLLDRADALRAELRGCRTQLHLEFRIAAGSGLTMGHASVRNPTYR